MACIERELIYALMAFPFMLLLEESSLLSEVESILIRHRNLQLPLLVLTDDPVSIIWWKQVLPNSRPDLFANLNLRVESLAEEHDPQTLMYYPTIIVDCDKKCYPHLPVSRTQVIHYL